MRPSPRVFFSLPGYYMSCSSPVPYKVGNFNLKTNKFKNIVLPRTKANLDSTSLRFPCGKCKGCRIDNSRQKAIRIEHEVQTQRQLYGRGSCFITLTYAPEHLPKFGNLEQSHFQAFMKKLRSSLTHSRSNHFISKDFKIKCVYCGEYGSNPTYAHLPGRPHFHAIIFGYDFPDKVFWQTRKNGNVLYRSKFLEELWPYGHSSIGSATWQSGAYVARYVMKKVSGDAALSQYQVIDESTGEVLFDRRPEFNQVGNGIGLDWFKLYHSDVYPKGELITRAGKRMKPPRYYDSKYELLDPEGMALLREQRQSAVRDLIFDNTEDRLAVKSKILDARLKMLKRDL